jgi:hypothetical protein
LSRRPRKCSGSRRCTLLPKSSWRTCPCAELERVAGASPQAPKPKGAPATGPRRDRAEARYLSEHH